MRRRGVFVPTAEVAAGVCLCESLVRSCVIASMAWRALPEEGRTLVLSFLSENACIPSTEHSVVSTED